MIGEFARELLGQTDEDWLNYIFAREPLAGRLTQERRRELYRGAQKCGGDFARSLLEKYGALPVWEIALREGAKVRREKISPEGAYTEFAKFIEPDEIIIFTDNAQATDDLIDAQGLREMIGEVKTQDVLLAHELFHLLEFRDPGAFTMRKHLLLWKLGPIKNESRVGCLEEIGAMECARVLTGISFSPYLFDVFMMYPANPQRAKMVYDSILALRKREEHL